MKLNSKLTWGLAWTGLAVVFAVPSADFLTGQFGGKAGTALITSTTDPVATGSTPAPVVHKTAAVTTKVTKTGVTIVPAGSTAPVLDPVDKLIKSGKPLPDYISDGDSTATTAPVKSPAISEEPTQVATIDPAAPLVAPMPFPRRPPDVARPALPKVTQPTQPTVIVDEAALAPDEDQIPDQLDVNDGPVPPAGIANDWQRVKDRKLARYLEQNGLIDDGSSASITVLERPSSDYDPNGFYLSDGPNNSRAARRARLERMLEDDNEDVTWF
jgi:hypothetical protein